MRIEAGKFQAERALLRVEGGGGVAELDEPEVRDDIGVVHGDRERLALLEFIRCPRNDWSNSGRTVVVEQVRWRVDLSVQIGVRPRRPTTSGKDPTIGEQERRRMVEPGNGGIGAKRPLAAAG